MDMEALEGTSPRRCEVCGAEIPDDAERCIRCGGRQAEIIAITPAIAVVAPKKEDPERPSLLAALACLTGLGALFYALALVARPPRVEISARHLIPAGAALLLALLAHVVIAVWRDKLIGRGMATLGILLGLVALSLTWAVQLRQPPGLRGWRGKLAQAKAEMKNTARALDAYERAHGAYPAWSFAADQNAFGALAEHHPELAGLPTFKTPARGGADAGWGPLPVDPFSPAAVDGRVSSSPGGAERGVPTFCYFVPFTGKGYILWSPGPDGKYDLTRDNIRQAYDPSRPAPSALLAEKTYDPTNGALSAGDVWQVK